MRCRKLRLPRQGYGHGHMSYPTDTVRTAEDKEDRMTHPGTPAFGLDDFGLDDRMRLFGYVTAENRLAYLWVLRAFDAARASYHVVLHTSEVATTLAGLTTAHPDCPDPAVLELPRLLDALVDWGVLDRGQDGARAA